MGSTYVSRWLIVATGENAEPVIPEIHGLHTFQGPIIHSSAYRSGSEFANQKVLVVGCGNSGMEVSLDLCRHHASPSMAVRDSVSNYSYQLIITFYGVYSHFSFIFITTCLGSHFAEGSVGSFDVYNGDGVAEMAAVEAC